MKKKSKLNHHKVKKAAKMRCKAVNNNLGGYCCFSLEDVAGKEYKDKFCKLFRPNHKDDDWTFHDSNEDETKDETFGQEVQDVRDLAMCLFYEIVKNGDY